MLVRVVAGLLVLAAHTAALGTPSTILKVPGDADTIQAAVDMAGPDTIIKVAKGFYEEAVTITGKTDLTLMGKGKPAISPGESNDAITITGCQNVVVQGFKLEHGTDGVEISDCYHVTVAKCLILQMSGQGVHASDSGFLVIEKNTVNGIEEHGLDIGDAPGVHDCSILKNKISEVGLHGIVIGGDANLAEKNKVSLTGGHGIETRSTVLSSSNVIRLNKVKDAGVVGLLCNGNDNVFEKNKVNGTGDDGMVIPEDATGNTLTGNTIGKAGEIDISVLGDTNDATANKVTKPSQDGFSVAGNSNTFESNKSTKAGSDGFHVAGTSNTFTTNKATGSADLDLEDENAPGANTYVDNKFPKNNLDL